MDAQIADPYFQKKPLCFGCQNHVNFPNCTLKLNLGETMAHWTYSLE